MKAVGRYLAAILTVLGLSIALWGAGCSAGGRSPFAIRDDWEPAVGQYIGGGQHFGRSRRATEGTWGRDYSGLDFFHIIDLRWSHRSDHRQVGLGSY